MGIFKNSNPTSTWRGDKAKETKLNYYTINPIFYSRLNVRTNIKCCCGDALTLNSRIYVFKVTSKDSKKSFYLHTGESCGRKLIDFSSRINNCSFRNIYFIETLNLNNEDAVARTYGLRDFQQPNNHVRYTQFNKAYLVSIFILCQCWNQPFPYGKLAEAIDAIHANPDVDCYLHIDFLNDIIKKDKPKQRKLIEMLEDYRKQAPGSFTSLNLDIIDTYVRNVLGLQSQIK